MARTRGPLFSPRATGTFAGAVTYTREGPSRSRRGEITRAAPALRFHAPRVSPPPSAAQVTARARLSAATAYAKAPPAQDLAAIALIARAESLPTFHAASWYYFQTHPPVSGVPWDAGATVWDGGATTWTE